MMYVPLAASINSSHALIVATGATGAAALTVAGGATWAAGRAATGLGCAVVTPDRAEVRELRIKRKRSRNRTIVMASFASP